MLTVWQLFPIRSVGHPGAKSDDAWRKSLAHIVLNRICGLDAPSGMPTASTRAIKRVEMSAHYRGSVAEKSPSGQARLPDNGHFQ